MSCCQCMRTRHTPEERKKKTKSLKNHTAGNFASVHIYSKLFLSINELVLYNKYAY